MSSSVGPISQDIAQAWLASDDSVDIVNAIVSVALYSEEREWVEHVVKRHLSHENCDVVSAAIISIGHCARIDRKCDIEFVRPFFMRYLKDDRYAGRVNDALDDVEVFTGLTRLDFGIE